MEEQRVGLGRRRWQATRVLMLDSLGNSNMLLRSFLARDTPLCDSATIRRTIACPHQCHPQRFPSTPLLDHSSFSKLSSATRSLRLALTSTSYRRRFCRSYPTSTDTHYRPPRSTPAIFFASKPAARQPRAPARCHSRIHRPHPATTQFLSGQLPTSPIILWSWAPS